MQLTLFARSRAWGCVLRITLKPENLHGTFVQEVEAISRQHLLDCNQCGRCSAGCPLVDEMDLLPSMVIRLAQLGSEDVLLSQTPWICAACLMCQTRCPKGVDIPRVMEAVRQVSLRRGDPPLITSQIDPALLATAPQMAVVGALRKAGK